MCVCVPMPALIFRYSDIRCVVKTPTCFGLFSLSSGRDLTKKMMLVASYNIDLQ